MPTAAPQSRPRAIAPPSDPPVPANSRGTVIAPARNPFVTIPYAWRVAIVVYAVVWKIVPAVLTAVFHNRGQEYVAFRLLLEVSSEALLVAPFAFRRFAGTPVGWLHPLAFSTLLAYGMGVVQNVRSLLHPLTAWFQPIERPFYHRLLEGWLAIDVAEAHLKGELLVLISLACAYAGFALFRPRIPLLRFGAPRQTTLRMLAVYVGIMLLAIALIQASGGLVEHITSFAQGRFRALGGLGPVVVVIAFAPALLAVWAVFDPPNLRKPWFYLLVALSLIIQFVTTGSRSGTFMPAVMIASAWIYHHRRVPAVRLLPFAFLALVGIGVLGDIRTSGWSADSARFSALTEFDLASSLELAQEELDSRNQNSAFLPTIAFVPDRVDLLWGRTYVGALAFFVPRALWPGKPRGAGAHVAAMIFGGMRSADNYQGGGIPPGPVAEAYWNFHIPGVIIIFALFGIFQRWLTELMRAYDEHPAVVGFFIIAIFYATAPASDTAIAFAQRVGVLIAVYLVLGVLPLRRRSERSSNLRFGARQG